MPIYEYRCEDCDRSFETFVMPGRTDAACPACHGAHIKREMSVFAARGASEAAPAANGSSRPVGGGCCGGGCGCA
jgi:putative FmdB family regulatory protein